jgi:hypothetical protein
MQRNMIEAREGGVDALAFFNKRQAEIATSKRARSALAHSSLERMNISFDALIESLDAFRDAVLIAFRETNAPI